MNIQEATKLALSKNQCMVRTGDNWISGIKIEPTNSKDCCYLIYQVDNVKGAMWNPSADDLMSDDWEICD